MRVSPKKIRSLKENEVYVFGSNERGRHGKGSAYIAAERFGAKEGIGFGLQGQSFAIPTKDKQIKTLAIIQIKYFVDQFIMFAKRKPELTFYVVEIGCMNAGYEPKDIAPLFKDAINIENIFLPERFWNVLTQEDNIKPTDTSDYEFSLFNRWKDDKKDEDFSLHRNWKDEDNQYDGIKHFGDDSDTDEGNIKHFQD